MAATNTTPNLELSQFVGSDKPDWLTDYNGDMSKIDSSYGAVDALAQAANSAAEAAAASATQAAADAAAALSGISGAVDAAAAAQAAAEQATSVANSALSVANGAASTAQSAAADAQQALAVANNAKVTAENAQAAAAQAVTDAQSAAADAQSASVAATQAATDAASAAAIAQGLQGDIDTANATASAALAAANKSINIPIANADVYSAASNDTNSTRLGAMLAAIDMTKLRPESVFIKEDTNGVERQIFHISSAAEYLSFFGISTNTPTAITMVRIIMTQSSKSYRTYTVSTSGMSVSDQTSNTAPSTNYAIIY